MQLVFTTSDSVILRLQAMITRSILILRPLRQLPVTSRLSRAARTYATARSTHPAPTRTSILGLPLSVPFLGRIPDPSSSSSKMSDAKQPQGLQVFPVQARSDNWMYR